MESTDTVSSSTSSLLTRETHPDGAHFTAAHAAEGQRVEDQHDVLGATEAREPHGSAVLIGQLEVGRLLAYLYRHASSFR